MRLCIGPGGELVVGRRGGRGAWLCRDSLACLEDARRRRVIGRALRAAVDDDAVQRLCAGVCTRDEGEGTSVVVCEDGAPGRRDGRRQAEQGT